MTTRLILIRHGESEDNFNWIYQGNGPGSGLTERGVKQAEAVALRLRDVKINAVYSSPKKRVIQTAEIINRYHNLKITFEDGLRDRESGILDGKIKTSLPPELMKLTENIKTDENLRIPGGESFKDVKIRVRKAVDKIVKENKDKTVLIVSHGNTVRAIVSEIIGISLRETYNKMNRSVNAGYTEIEINGKPKLIKFFCREHLADL